MRSFFSFKGRITRETFFGELIALFICAVGCGIFLAIPEFFELTLPDWINIIFVIVEFIVIAVIALKEISLTVRRLHDINVSGWWYPIVAALPYVLLYLILITTQSNLFLINESISDLLPWLVKMCVIGAIPGTNSENRFGINPIPQRDRQVPDGCSKLS